MEDFKAISELDKPDIRRKSQVIYDREFHDFRPITVEEFHSVIAAIKLSSQVPEDIQSAFNTAKNTLLYSWFAYGLVPLAVLHAYGTIEYALKKKIGSQSEKRGLKWCLKVAIDRNWIQDNDFSRYRDIEAKHRANYIRVKNLARPAKIPANDPHRYCRILQDTLPSLRNSHAHGHAMLYPWGEDVLELAADLINQLFISTKK